MHHGIARFVQSRYAPEPGTVRLRLTALRGGLECAGVTCVRAEFQDRRQRRCVACFVAKRAYGHAAREVDVYRHLLAECGGSLAPRLLGAEDCGGDGAQFYLEWIRPWRAWPWRDAALLGRAMELLALAHASLSAERFQSSGRLAQWNYENHLSASAAETLDEFEREMRVSTWNACRRALPAMRRLAGRMPALRRQIGLSDLGASVLHGDAHSGNVVVRARAGALQPVLLDWGRARIGSPLEDVSSWLQCLGYWEPQARSLHDTLFRRYLAARGYSDALSRTLRDAYWIAAAGNGLAGAIRSHVLTIADPARPEKSRRLSHGALRDWLRIVLRADAVSRG